MPLNVLIVTNFKLQTSACFILVSLTWRNPNYRDNHGTNVLRVLIG